MVGASSRMDVLMTRIESPARGRDSARQVEPASLMPVSERNVAFLHESHTAGLAVALVATSVDNANEVAELWDPRALDLLCRQQKLQVYCLASHARLVHATAAGGLLVAVVADDEAALVTRVAELAARLRSPVEIDQQQVWPLITLGARVCRPGESLDTCSRLTRATLSEARTMGTGNLLWHQPGGADDAPSQLTVINDLVVALNDDRQFRLHYQPLRDLRTGQLVGAESLLRWHHPVRGSQPASSAIGTAERCGLIRQLGQRVLDISLKQLATWLPLVPSSFRLHVNASPIELSTPGYAEGVAHLLHRHGIPGSMLLLEITETTAMSGQTDAVATLHQLAELGVGLGIDDFGTGYSSIAYLRDLPIDTVKVDRSLISGVASSMREYEMAAAIARLLSVMPVRVLAEGIESAEQQALLLAVGYHYGQGYHLGAPAPRDVLTLELREGRSNQVTGFDRAEDEYQRRIATRTA